MTRSLKSPLRLFIEQNLSMPRLQLLQAAKAKFPNIPKHRVSQQLYLVLTLSHGGGKKLFSPRPLKALLEDLNPVDKIVELLSRMPRGQYVEDSELRRAVCVPAAAWSTISAHEKLAKWRYNVSATTVIWVSPRDQQNLTKQLDKIYGATGD